MEGRPMAGGMLILSVDLELEIDHSDQVREERLDAVRSHLVRLAEQHRVPATWAVADPYLSAATDQVLRSGVGHELAVLGDRTWIGPGYGRGRIARELDRRFTRARKVGIPVITLALRNVGPASILEILQEHRVSAVRGPAVDSSAQARLNGTAAIRFGAWQSPTAWRVPLRPRWWHSSAWAIRREIRRTIHRGSTLHLAIDGPRLVDWGSDALRVIESVVQFAAARRDAGLLRIATLGQLAQEALRERAAVSTRSILRPAA
jgi:hypothetical protein